VPKPRETLERCGNSLVMPASAHAQKLPENVEKVVAVVETAL
jgi:hypothetical protein